VPPRSVIECYGPPGGWKKYPWDRPDVDDLPPDPTLLKNALMYKASPEYAGREELLDLMAEQREEMSWERHHGYSMPEFEKGGFHYKDPEVRKERMDKLEELLEQARVSGLERDRMRAS
jgi:hypothetical protein